MKQERTGGMEPKQAGMAVIGFEPLFVGADEKTAAAGQSIFLPDDYGYQVFLVRSGRVRIYRNSPDGRELTLAIIGPGEIFGEIALLDGGGRTATALALVETHLAVLDREKFLKTIADQPETALVLMMLLCRRLRQTDEMVEEMTFLGVKERLHNLINRLDSRGGRDLAASLTHQDLADMIGTSRESVTRAMMEMRKEARRA